jgi:putative pyruvate formate lyase activating enzyme
MILPAARSFMDPIEVRLSHLRSRMSDCDLCPRRCHVDRIAGNVGICGMDSQIRIASANLHHGEEPPLSGTRGSGTIFLTGCNLKCVYCQNYPISQMRHGRLIFPTELVDTMLELQRRGAHNINFVTPTHYIAPVAEAIYEARRRGLTVPIVYNTSGYDAVDALREIEGLIDVYLPDMRYSDSSNSQCYSSAPDYTTVNRAAIKEMFRQVGLLETDDDGIAKRGLIIRHLVLPENISGTEETLRFIAEEISTECHISLMSQYFPAHRAETIRPLDRRLTSDEYKRATEWMSKYKLENGWCQNEEI